MKERCVVCLPCALPFDTRVCDWCFATQDAAIMATSRRVSMVFCAWFLSRVVARRMANPSPCFRWSRDQQCLSSQDANQVLRSVGDGESSSLVRVVADWIVKWKQDVAMGSRETMSSPWGWTQGSLGWLMRAFCAARAVAGGVAGRRKGPSENVGCEIAQLLRTIA